MTTESTETPLLIVPRHLTPRGARTRARILEAAADLVLARGVTGTSLDDVRAATGTSKSQLYHYFDSKAALVRAVIARQRDLVLAEQQLDGDPLVDVEALTRWRYRTISVHRARGFARPCPLGALAAEVTDDDLARAELAAAFDAWAAALAAGLERMQREGRLRPEADPRALGLLLLSAVQGGLVLACARRDAQPLRQSLDEAIGRVLSLTRSVEPGIPVTG